MKASILEKLGGPFTTKEVDLDEPKGHEVLVDIKASGLCHSDLHVKEDGYGYIFPAVLGHEIAGVVKAIGKDVKEFKVGDHVVACLIQFCGHCEACLSGNTHLCEHPEETLRDKNDKPRLSLHSDGSPINQGYGIGGFAEQSLVHENQLAKIPDDMPFSRACILGCGTVTGAGAIINTAKVRPGDSVAIIGTGGVGLNAISGAKIAGAATIIAIDLDDDKLEMSKRFGATHTINSSKTDPIKKVKEITDGKGVDAAFEVIGLKPTAEQALAMSKKGGNAYLIGIQKPGSKLEIAGWEEIVSQAKRLQGVWMGSTNLKHDIPMFAKLYKEGRMNLDDLIYKEINIDEVDSAYDELNKRGIVGRAVITSF